MHPFKTPLMLHKDLQTFHTSLSPRELHLADELLLDGADLVVPAAFSRLAVPEFHTVLVPPVEAVGLVFAPVPAGQRRKVHV